jgi:hypothetical protein
VAERVVNALESVEVNKQDRQGVLVTSCVRQFIRKLLAE